MANSSQNDRETILKNISLLKTLGTLVNVLGLAIGLAMFKYWPDWATLLVVLSIVLYGIFRFGVGWLEWHHMELLAKTGRSGRGPGAPAGRIPTEFEGTLTLKGK